MTRTTTPTRSAAVPPAVTGPDHALVDRLADYRSEPRWMREFRHRALDVFHRRPLPTWGGDLSALDFDALRYLPEDADAPGAAPSAAAPDAHGVLVLDTHAALREHEALLREHWASLAPPEDNKFAALNGAVWSGGTFVYVPRGVRVALPVAAVPRRGPFERTLIVVEDDAELTFIDGQGALTAPPPLHNAVVEIIVRPRGRCRYAAVERWPAGAYNLSTKRAVAHEGATVVWVDATLGGRLTMQYPAVHLRGRGAHAEVYTASLAPSGGHQDTGGKLVCHAPEGTGKLVTRAAATGTGRATFRALVKVHAGAERTACAVDAKTLLVGPAATGDAYPYIEIEERSATVDHDPAITRMDVPAPDDGDTAAAVREFLAPVAAALPPGSRAELDGALRALLAEPGAAG